MSKLASLVYLDGHWLFSLPLATHALSLHNATRVQRPSVKRLPGAMGSVTFRKITLFIPTILPGLGPVPFLAAFQHTEQRETLCSSGPGLESGVSQRLPPSL